MDLKHCASGKNDLGAWHVACDTTGAPALQILQNMGYTGTLSTLGISYYKAARWIVSHHGASWTTNALNVPTTANTLPAVDPF